MSYDPEKYSAGLREGIRTTGVIRRVFDGQPKDFLTPEQLKKWHGQDSVPAINVLIDFVFENVAHEYKKIFTYENGPEGQVIGKPRSAIGRFVKKYGRLPIEKMQVTMITNANGDWNIELAEEVKA